MASDLTKVKLGPCKVIFDAGGTDEVTIETTQGGVVLTYETTSREVTVDQFGSTPIREIITGRTATVEAPFAEYDIVKLAKFIPGSKLVTDALDPTKQRVDVDASKIIDLINYAKKLQIIPLSSDATANDTITLYKAAPTTTLNYTYSFDNELITNVSFKGYPDENGRLIGLGDPDATE
ncbi:hypothetical protein PACILC2_22840 [Paenibacillus cisolokensis]|uniref:Uncharacterized protein n=1 Tax=Paenibacillus cisolokensis TaxID=1658519 RepID=A0ABQ4N6F4_9BACL|nr:hypothetical protein [Paenibacillus cisolokensis]GIQ63716.1 hypothetical protein PACILC2_22840 [Paenibacillus cisolokensis]